MNYYHSTVHTGMPVTYAVSIVVIYGGTLRSTYYGMYVRYIVYVACRYLWSRVAVSGISWKMDERVGGVVWLPITANVSKKRV